MPRENRRRFLKRAAAAVAASVAAPVIVRSSALGAGGAVPPSERINMGAIGIGGRGRYVMGAFLRSPDVRMLAVCDVRRERRERAKAQVDGHYGDTDCAAYVDLNELLSRDDVDAVMVATGANWHALASVLAAKAGKDVYSEKPGARTVAEGRALVEAVSRYGRVYQCGTQRRSIIRFRLAADLARTGRLGDLKTLRAEAAGRVSVPGAFTHPPEAQPPRDVLDWDRWLGPAPWRPYNPKWLGGWKRHRDFQGGSISEWCSHTIDLCQMALGADDTSPVHYEYIGDEGDRIRCRYANGVDLVIQDGKWPLHVKFEGTEGWAYVDDDGRIDAEPRSLLGGRNFGKGYPAEGHVGAFLDAVKSRRRTISHAEASHRSMTACHCANVCLLLGRPVEWDPKAERFVDDPEADRYLARAMRPPWRV